MAMNLYKQHRIWNDNNLQFPRLLAEIVATVNISPRDRDALLESMDITEDELDELFDRAQTEFENIKEQVCQEDTGIPECIMCGRETTRDHVSETCSLVCQQNRVEFDFRANLERDW
jgi:hypothetical protein